MDVTFGRLGRVFLLAGGAASVLALISLAVLGGVARASVAGSLGVVGVVGLIQGLVWTLVQHRMFGSVTALRQVAATGVPTTAVIVAVRSTSSAIGAEPIVRLDLVIHGQPVTRHVRVPFNHAAEVRPGRTLPVRIDPADTRAMFVEWERLP
ncbi:hypothetical protein [Streptomyces sp. NPDC058653]|uniref:hypothetical protein n=1 Tax=Streptomyces sp. NPDC058653 TaxID=3346576 RepID=UPI00365E7B38